MPSGSHAGDHSHRKNTPTLITAMGRKNTSTGRFVSPPIAKLVPQKRIRVGSMNTSAGRRYAMSWNGPM